MVALGLRFADPRLDYVSPRCGWEMGYILCGSLDRTTKYCKVLSLAGC